MTSITRTAVAVALAAGLGATGLSAANAQIPGADNTGWVVVTDSNIMTVTVNPASATATQITGTIRNNSGSSFRCSGPSVKSGEYFPNSVASAAVVQATVKYYSHTILAALGGMPSPAGDPIKTGSLAQFFPTGSAGQAQDLGPTASYDIAAALERDRLAGHAGNIYTGSNTTNISVGSGATVSWKADLGAPVTGVRTDFNAAAFFLCADTNSDQNYGFAGYETTP